MPPIDKVVGSSTAFDGLSSQTESPPTVLRSGTGTPIPDDIAVSRSPSIRDGKARANPLRQLAIAEKHFGPFQKPPKGPLVYIAGGRYTNGLADGYVAGVPCDRKSHSGRLCAVICILVWIEAFSGIGPANTTICEPHTEPPFLPAWLRYARLTLRLAPGSLSFRNERPISIAVPSAIHPEICITLSVVRIAEQAVTAIELQLWNW